MKELGEYLKRTRISNGVSITEACEDLEFSTSQLENIESGNVKAFKDVYDFKDSIKAYAKYLGLDPDKVVDEFNAFFLKKQKEEGEKKVRSPYTKEYKEKVNLWPVFYVILGCLLIIGIAYLIVSNINKAPTQTDELKGIAERKMFL